MRRRRLLAAGTAVFAGGCLGRGESYHLPAPLDSPPDGVYVPSHAADLAVASVADAGDLRLALCYSYPDRFWDVTGRATYRRDARDEVHLMVQAWEPATGVILPELGVSVEVTREGEPTYHEAVYPMLSQRLGFHYGDNVPLPEDARYAVTVRVGGTSVRRTGAFAGRFDGGASHTFTIEYARAARNALETIRPEDAGTRGALSPAAPEGVPAGGAGALPGRRLPAGSSDDARLPAAVLSGAAADRFGTDRYLAVSPRTPYTGTLLPAMGLTARVDRGGHTVFVESLERTLDPGLGYHYGAAVPPIEPGDRLLLDPLTPPQVARHEGYETAFLEMDPTSVAVPD